MDHYLYNNDKRGYIAECIPFYRYADQTSSDALVCGILIEEAFDTPFRSLFKFFMEYFDA